MKLPQRSKRKISKIRRLLAVHISFNVDRCKFKVKLSNNFLDKYKQQDKEVPIYNKRCMYGNYEPDYIDRTKHSNIIDETTNTQKKGN